MVFVSSGKQFGEVVVHVFKMLALAFSGMDQRREKLSKPPSFLEIVQAVQRTADVEMPRVVDASR